jgi:hypothetical protein
MLHCILHILVIFLMTSQILFKNANIFMYQLCYVCDKAKRNSKIYIIESVNEKLRKLIRLRILKKMLSLCDQAHMFLAYA